MQVKNGDKFRICDTNSSCCQEHVFEVETMQLGIRLEAGFNIKYQNFYISYENCF